MSTRHPTSPRHADYTVRLWALESGDATLSPDSAADALPLGHSRWLEDALDLVDDGTWACEELPAA